MSLIDPFVQFIKETSFEDIPQEVREQAKIRIIDLISACGIGYFSGVNNPLLSFVHELNDIMQATIFFNKKRCFVSHAAACNTFLANSSGMEDGSRFAGAHPSSAIIPSALAMAEAVGASGKELIAAVVIAYDVYLRIGNAIYPNNLRRGFQASAILAPIGSAAVAGKILDLDLPALKSCLSLACLSAGGLKVAFEAYASKCYQIARGVKAGIEASLLAQNGLQGPDRVLEGGFLKAYGGELEKLETKNLGLSFYLPYTYLKIHAGCRLIHPCIDAVLFLKKKEKFTPEQVEKILIRTSSAAYEMERDSVKNIYDARFNTPFLVALALNYGEVLEDQIKEKILKNQRIKSLLPKIKVEVSCELDQKYPQQRGAEVVIHLKEGRILHHKVDFAEGEPENPLSINKIKKKFQRSFQKILSHDQISFVYSFLQKLENQESIGSFCEKLGDIPKGTRKIK